MNFDLDEFELTPQQLAHINQSIARQKAKTAEWIREQRETDAISAALRSVPPLTEEEQMALALSTPTRRGIR